MTLVHVPCWMNEGIARVVDGLHNDKEHPAGAKPSIESLRKSFVKETNTEKATKLYWYSRRMVEELLKNDGGGQEAFPNFANCLQDLCELKMDGVI